ncbi:hypothetical protein D5R81_18765 [Parashewanella spongiae]|uniref:Uncharacterized protein n=1 Tax=Parashewanella spongiae TaxID=342950 RepID=A0A3A6TC75_9GAMM|nr:hypothetical protein [Parashewanella spongiae]MCL1080090.1 hypothetical protein [Parashewanella spongiae]RJY05094.1 hypothetical protein D5R81_18765 [Parashewanella spongiae]
MSFDYGSINLGLKNPFKFQGWVTAAHGTIETCLGIFLLFSAAQTVKLDLGISWILVGFGILLLSRGLYFLGSGIYATMRYFVGRNHPTSLAKNHSPSQGLTSDEEKKYVGYKSQELEEMLLGRKNSTFVEPNGFLARLLHTLLPKLLFMPYPIRNMAQTIFGAWVKTCISMVAYALTAFVCLTGLAGQSGELIFPFYSLLITLYLIFIWKKAANPINRIAEQHISTLGVKDIIHVIAVSLVSPALIGVGINYFASSSNITTAKNWLLAAPEAFTSSYIFVICIFAAAVTAVTTFLLRARLLKVDPIAEVSELRENWQESVHPDEIFINLDNLVMANRRYKEVPNRIYQALDPKLTEQVKGKGTFSGKMMQEVQPKVRPLQLGATFEKFRVASLIIGACLFTLVSIAILFLTYASIDLYSYATNLAPFNLAQLTEPAKLSALSPYISSIWHWGLIAFIVTIFARMFKNSAHLFYAEIQFESTLIYFKCEGTFTESQISTGTGIHDSTRSENTLVRSSITPWIIVTKIISTTYAATGMKNLEHPRHILEIHKDDAELMAIKNDLISFLRDRESIAAITSERDLGNASQIHALNEQTRAIPTQPNSKVDEAAGYLQQQNKLKEFEHQQEPESQS